MLLSSKYIFKYVFQPTFGHLCLFHPEAGEEIKGEARLDQWRRGGEQSHYTLEEANRGHGTASALPVRTHTGHTSIHVADMHALPNIEVRFREKAGPSWGMVPLWVWAWRWTCLSTLDWAIKTPLFQAFICQSKWWRLVLASVKSQEKMYK